MVKEVMVMVVMQVQAMVAVMTLVLVLVMVEQVGSMEGEAIVAVVDTIHIQDRIQAL